MGLRAYFEQQTTIGTTDRLEIHIDGYSGNAHQMIAERRGFTFQHSEITSESNDGFLSPLKNKIQIGKLDFYPHIRTDADRQVLFDISDAEDNQVLVIWKIDGDVEWKGYSNSKLLDGQESKIFNGRIRADDFEILKGIDYPLSEGRQTWIQTLADLFGYTGYGLPIQTSTSWIIDGGDSSKDFLQQAEHDVKALRKFKKTGDETDETINVFQALQYAAAPALLIRQQHGKFLVEQLTAFSDPANVLQTTYDTDGNVSTASATVDRTQTIYTSKDLGSPHMKGKSGTGSYPAIKQARVKYDHRTEVAGIQFESFIELDSSTTSKSYSQLLISDGDQTISISALINAEFPTKEAAEWRWELQAENYWWDQDDYEWKLNTQVTNFLPLSGGQLQAGNGDWKYFGNLAVETAAVPADADGDLIITFYRASNSTDGFVDSQVRVLDFTIINAIASENSTSIDYQLTQPGGYSESYSHADTIFGDGPVGYAPGAISINDVYTSDDWARRGESNFRNFHRVLLEEVINPQRGRAKKTIADIVGGYDPELVSQYNGDDYYYVGGRYTSVRGRYEPILMRINIEGGVSDVFDDIPKFTDEAGSGSGTSSGSGGSATWNNITGKPSTESDWATETGFDSRYANLSDDNTWTGNNTFAGDVGIEKDAARFDFNRPSGASDDFAFSRFLDDDALEAEWGWDYANERFLARDGAGDKFFAAKPPNSSATSPEEAFFVSDRFHIYEGGNIGNGRMFLFMDIDEWSSYNNNADVANANNFHYFNEGLTRVEFEANGAGAAMQFYIEGGENSEVWYGLQNGSNHEWSFGITPDNNNTFVFTTGFSLSDATTRFAIKKTGYLGTVWDPQYPFDWRGTNAGLLTRYYNEETGGEGVLIRAGETDATDRAFQVGSRDYSNVPFTVLSNGASGFGTTTPSYPLEVQRHTAGLAARFYNDNSGGTGAEGVLVRAGETGRFDRVFQAASRDASVKGFSVYSNAFVGHNVTGDPSAFFHSQRGAVAGLHQSVAGHQDWLFESDVDGIMQLASNNAGAVGTGVVFTNQEAAGDGRHWVFEHAGTTESNRFGIGYYTSAATGENILTGYSPTAYFNTDKSVDWYGDHATDNFAEGWAGTGWQGTRTGDWEVENLRVRGALRVYEFIAKQLSSIGGTEILSIANGRIESVNAGASTITVDTVSGTAQTSFKANDLWIVQVVNVNNDLESGGTGSIVRQIRGSVTSVSGATLTVSVDAGSPDDLSALEQGDLIVAYGNSSNAARQAIMYRNVDRSEDNLIMRLQTGVDAFADLQNTDNTAVAFGDLNGYAGLSSETFGFYAGDYANNYVLVTESDVKLYPNEFKLSVNGLNIDSTAPRIDVGSSHFLDGASNNVGFADQLFYARGDDGEIDLSVFTVTSNHLTDGNTYIGDRLFDNYSDGNLFVGNLLTGSRPAVMTRDSAGNFVQMFWEDADNWGMWGQQGGNDVFRLGSDNRIASAYFDQRYQWAPKPGAANPDDPTALDDIGYRFDAQEGRIYFGAMVYEIYKPIELADYGENSTDAADLTDEEWSSFTLSIEGSGPVNNEVRVLNAEYIHRFGFNNIMVKGLIKGSQSTQGGATITSTTYEVRAQINGETVSASTSSSTYESFEIMIDLTGSGANLSVGNKYNLEIIVYVQISGNAGTSGDSDQFSGATYLREDVSVLATT